jgi:transposase-like protein
MSLWSTLSREQRLQIIRQGYLNGHSNSRIGEALDVSKNTVVALAWRWYLNAGNAHGWKIAKCRPTPPRYGQRRARPKLTIEQRRARLQNSAKDAASRISVASLNALPFGDIEIAVELDVATHTISNWRRGRHRVTPFMQQCVATLVARMNPTEPKDGTTR